MLDARRPVAVARYRAAAITWTVSAAVLVATLVWIF
jgi:hypothetical protein